MKNVRPIMDKIEDSFKERQPGEFTAGEIACKLMVYSTTENNAPHSLFVSKVANKLFPDKYSRKGRIGIGDDFRPVCYYNERIISYIMEYIETSSNYILSADKQGNRHRVYKINNKNYKVKVYKNS